MFGFKKKNKSYLDDMSPNTPIFNVGKGRYKKRVKKIAIVEFMRQHEGEPLYIEKIAEHVGITVSYASILIRELAKARFIRIEGEGYGKRYFVNPKTTMDPRDVHPGPSPDTEYGSIRPKVLEFIAKNDGKRKTTYEIADAVGTSRAYVNRVLLDLAAEGAIIQGDTVNVGPEKGRGTVYWIEKRGKNG